MFAARSPNTPRQSMWLTGNRHIKVRGKATTWPKSLCKYRYFSGGSTYGAVDSAAGQLEAARFALQEIRLVLREKILSGWAELISARTRSELGKKQTIASQSLLGGYIKQFQIGRRTLLDLLNAQSDLYNYQTATVTAEFEQRIAQARILAAIGKLAMASYDQETNSSRKPISSTTNQSSTYVYTSK
jgi:outer membrane protein TolC